MVECSAQRLDSVFKALGDVTRRQMLQRLAGCEQSISELATPFKMTLAAASKHVRVLERAGLVRREKRGRTHYCQIEPKALAQAHDWVGAYEKLWTGQLDKLDHYLMAQQKDSQEHV